MARANRHAAVSARSESSFVPSGRSNRSINKKIKYGSRLSCRSMEQIVGRHDKMVFPQNPRAVIGANNLTVSERCQSVQSAHSIISRNNSFKSLVQSLQSKKSGLSFKS